MPDCRNHDSSLFAHCKNVALPVALYLGKTSQKVAEGSAKPPEKSIVQAEAGVKKQLIGDCVLVAFAQYAVGVVVCPPHTAAKHVIPSVLLHLDGMLRV